MYQSYLLLRNNEQTGPYTLEQLLQLNLKPFDLVWEEGRSAAWRYPGEIDSLKIYMTPVESTPETHNAPSKKVFVSMPGKRPVQQVAPATSEEPPTDTDAFIRQKAEDIRLRVQNYAEHNQQHGTRQSFEREEPAYSYFQKSTVKKRMHPKHAILLSGIGIAAFATWYFISPDNVPLPDAKPPATIISSTTPVVQKEDETHPVISSDATNEPAAVKNISSHSFKLKPAANKDVPATKVITPAGEPVVIKKEDPPVIVEQEIIPAAGQENPVKEPAGNKKEKKKLRDVVRNIFSAKDKEKADAEEEIPQPAIGRKANKRNEENAVVPGNEEIRENVDISSNDRGNWMMGVSGLKVTVRNRNNLPLESVIVIVSYFDSNEKLLEKKELNFRNITANGKMTLTAPENRWADHTKISLGTIEAGKDAYVLDR